jgi:hypothetical protein
VWVRTLGLMCLLSATSAVAADVPVRVLTSNVHHGEGTDAEPHFDRRDRPARGVYHTAQSVADDARGRQPTGARVGRNRRRAQSPSGTAVTASASPGSGTGVKFR